MSSYDRQFKKKIRKKPLKVKIFINTARENPLTDACTSPDPSFLKHFEEKALTGWKDNRKRWGYWNSSLKLGP